MKKLLFVLSFLLFSTSLFAQAGQSGTGGLVVATCGTLPANIVYRSGSTRIPTMDVNGVTCSNAQITGSVTVTGSSTSGMYVWTGAAWTQLLGDATNGAFVNVKTSVLPTGASTSAKQPALGTAGTASTDVITVQGIASMTPVLATLSGTNNINNISGTVSLPTGAATGVAQGSTTSGQVGTLLQGAVTTSAPTYTNAQTSPLSLDTTGSLRVNVTAGGGVTFTPCYVKAGIGTTNDTTNHANCKNAAGTFYGVRAINTSGTVAYLRMYNLTTDPTCSSSTGFVESIPIPASTTGAGLIDPLSTFSYGTGISYCVTGGGGNTDNTAPPAGVYITIATF